MSTSFIGIFPTFSVTPLVIPRLDPLRLLDHSDNGTGKTPSSLISTSLTMRMLQRMRTVKLKPSSGTIQESEFDQACLLSDSLAMKIP